MNRCHIMNDYSTAQGQIQLMRESVGQPTHFRRTISSGFTPGQTLEFKDLNLRHPSNRVEFIRDGKPEGGNTVIVVKHRSGTTGEWLARDFQPSNSSDEELKRNLRERGLDPDKTTAAALIRLTTLRTSSASSATKIL